MKKRVISLLLAVVLLCSFPFTAFAASYPLFLIDYEKSDLTIVEGGTGSLVFTLFPEYKNERYHVEVFDSYGNQVGNASDSVYNTSSMYKTVTVNINTTKLEMGPGEYTVKYYMEFYTYFEWHTTPNARTCTLTITPRHNCNGNHEYGLYRLVTENTCVTGGVAEMRCIYCDDSYFEEFPPSGHHWDNGTVIAEPTELSAGQVIYYCNNCDETKTETLPALGHTHTETKTPPTCTEQGYTTFVCGCGHSYVGDYVDPAGHDWNDGVTDSASGETLYTCNVCGVTESKIETTARRLSGSNRFETAVAISSAGWTSADTVIIASGENYPDALAGAVLSKAHNAPILLTSKSQLNSKVLEEIYRLGAKNVIILGGIAAVSNNVSSTLAGSFNVTRIDGANRNHTAALVALQATSHSDTVFLVSNQNYADALSAGSAAALMGAPILYVNPNGSIPAETANVIRSLGCTKAYIIGGEAAINPAVETKLKALNINYVRVSGSDRYQTSVAVYNEFKDLYFSSGAAIATGTGFPDALAGGALAASKGMPVFLVGANASPALVEKFDQISVNTLYVFGGTNAVSEAVVNTLID